MKELLISILFFVTAWVAQAQSSAWKSKVDFMGTVRSGAVGFSINGKGYIGTGGDVAHFNFVQVVVDNEVKDFWEYNPVSNTWSQKADFGGLARYAAVGFSVNNKGYIGTGRHKADDTGSAFIDFWEYDPITNAWTRKADFGGGHRYGSEGFSINGKGYIGTGNNGTFTKDFWEYDPTIDIWTQKAPFGGAGRDGAVGFSINGKGYIGTGRTASPGTFVNDFYEYNPLTDEWIKKADFAGGSRFGAEGFSIKNKGYVGTGNDDDGNFYKDFWEYDPAANKWLKRSDIGISSTAARSGSVGFSIGDKGYIGGGSYLNRPSFFKYNVIFYRDFWEYSTLTAWTAAANTTDWHTPLNWDNGLPTGDYDAIVNTGPANMPIITNTAAAQDIIIGTGASLTLNAVTTDLTVYGNLLNSGTYLQQLGNVTFADSTETQIIPVLPYYNVITSGLATKVLGGNITVNNLAIFDNILTAPVNTNLTLNGSLAGEDNGHYLKGTVIKAVQVNTTATSQDLKSGNIGIEFSGVTTDFGTMRITRTTGIPVQNPGNAALQSIARQWKIESSQTPAPPVAPVTITFSWLSADNNNLIFTNNLAQVWRKTANPTTWVKAGAPLAITTLDNLNSITAPGLTDLGEFTITDVATALPVTWLSFKGEKNSNGVHINWVTATEKNTRSFGVERSLDGETFIPVGTVAAAGNSTSQQHYRYLDQAIPAFAGKVVYYRLNQLDLDAHQAFSKIIAINLNQGTTVRVYPNPFNQELTIMLPNASVTAHDLVTLTTMEGKVIYTKSLSGYGTNFITLEEVAILPRGIYFLQIRLDNQLITTKIVKK